MSVTPSELAYLPQHDQAALNDWLGYHAQLHKQVQTKAVQDGHTDLGVFWVADMVDKDQWTYWHYQDHVNIASTYSLAAPPDLGYWDFDDPNSFNNWLFSHSLVHGNEKTGLGLI